MERKYTLENHKELRDKSRAADKAYIAKKKKARESLKMRIMDNNIKNTRLKRIMERKDKEKRSSKKKSKKEDRESNNNSVSTRFFSTRFKGSKK